MCKILLKDCLIMKKNDFPKIQYWWWFIHALNHILFKFYNFVALNFFYEFKRRIKNKNNLTHLWRIVNINKITVWNYSSWILNIRLSDTENSYVKIWNYCCIAEEVEFLCLSNHPTDWFMNEWIAMYMDWGLMFKINNPYYKPCKLSKKDKDIISNNIRKKMNKTCHWPIIVDDDVRIWTWAKIMSWVHIWQWAVIWAWAVVTKDIPPYAIVWWIPAKIVKYRFDENKIRELLKINFSKVTIEDLSTIYAETMKEDFNCNFLLKKLT